MLQTSFLWFYCLSIPAAVLLILLLTAGYLMLRQWLGKQRFWRVAMVLFLLAWLSVIAAATLADRTPDAFSAAPELLPFHSYRAVMAGGNPELLRSNFMNAVLFYPLGLLGCEALPRGWSRKQRVWVVFVLCVLLSLGIEFVQYLFVLGQAEIDDVIHNGLGALIGATICQIHPWQSFRRKVKGPPDAGNRIGSHRG